jgi:hypothetical protein
MYHATDYYWEKRRHGRWQCARNRAGDLNPSESLELIRKKVSAAALGYFPTAYKEVLPHFHLASKRPQP